MSFTRADYTSGARLIRTALTDQKPPSWRETISLICPNTKASLTALISGLEVQKVTSLEHRWYEKSLASRLMTVASDNGTTALVVGAGEAYKAPKGTILECLETGQKLRVTADTTDGATFVSPTRDLNGDTATDTLTAGQRLYVLSYAGAESEAYPTAVDRDPTEVYNYLQEFEESMEMSNRWRASYDRAGDPFQNQQLEALMRYAINKEQAFLFGPRYKSDDGKVTTTGGVKNFITTNRFTDVGELTYDTWDTITEGLLKYQSDIGSTKILYCGSTFLRSVTSLERKRATMNINVGQGEYGLRMTKIITPNGEINLVRHPLFCEHPEWTKAALCVDLSNLKYLYLDGEDDDFFQVNKDGVTSVDGKKSKLEKYAFHSICGVEVGHEKTHGWIEGVTGFAGE